MVLKKLSVSLILLLALLSGCGGGGDGTSDPSPSVATVQLTTSTPIASVTVATPTVVNPFQTPAKLQRDKYRLAIIDYRFDPPASNKDINGHHTTSFEAVKPMIDKSKAIGFTGILLTLQIPVNIKTGLVAYYDQPPNIKTLPKDLWKVVEYAKNNDMQVWLTFQRSSMLSIRPTQ